jgi:protein-L-isoaspartate(D-aspartate) O-methyltransferase
MEVKRVRPALDGSYESLFHEAGEAQWLLPLRAPLRDDVVPALSAPLLERAIGVIYRPRTERESHYFEAVLPRQFDEYIWFDTTSAVAPLTTRELHGLPDTYPFGV